MTRSLIACLLFTSHLAGAATVRGTITLPPPAQASPPDGLWRVENGLLPIGPPQPEPRSLVLVALEGGPTKSKGRDAEEAPPVVTAELHGLRLDPPLVVARLGATVEFKNNDRAPHTLYLEHASSLMPPEPTPTGKSRTQRFMAQGEYALRDQECPHLSATVLVIDTPHVARLDDKGSFKLEVPEGHYTLRVYYNGAWVVSRPLDVSSHSVEVAIQVAPPSGAGRGE